MQWSSTRFTTQIDCIRNHERNKLTNSNTERTRNNKKKILTLNNNNQAMIFCFSTNIVVLMRTHHQHTERASLCVCSLHSRHCEWLCRWTQTCLIFLLLLLLLQQRNISINYYWTRCGGLAAFREVFCYSIFLQLLFCRSKIWSQCRFLSQSL